MLCSLSYLFLRGQGVKIFSLVSKECAMNNTLIPVIKYENEEIKIDDKAYNNNKEVMFEYGEDDEGVVTDNDVQVNEGAIVRNHNWYLCQKTKLQYEDYGRCTHLQ